jgi:hypothetical protein
MKEIVKTIFLISVLLNLVSCSKKNEMNKDEIRISKFFNDEILSNEEFYKLRPLKRGDISNSKWLNVVSKVNKIHPFSAEIGYPLSKKDLLRYKKLSKLEKKEVDIQILELNADLVIEIINCSGDLGAMTSYINNQIKFKNKLLCSEELSAIDSTEELSVNGNIDNNCYQQEIAKILESKLILPDYIEEKPFIKRLSKLKKDIKKCNATLSEHNEHKEDSKTPVKPFTKRFN